jgi:hypothetical protein
LVFLVVATACGGATRTQATGSGGGRQRDSGVHWPGSGSGGSGGAPVDSGTTSSGGVFHVDPMPTVFPPLPQDPKDCDDHDGLTYDEEIAAGTDPCKADTDGDGCIDGAEVKLGGCDDARNGVIVTACMGNNPTTRVRFTAPDRDGGSWESITLRENASDQPGLSVDIVATGGLLRPSGATYHDVPGGALLEFEVSVLPSLATGTGVVRLELYAQGDAADGGDAGAPRLVDRGEVLVVLRFCPLP